MDTSGVLGMSNPATGASAQEQEFVKQGELLRLFYNIPSIDRAWAYPSQRGRGMDVVVAMSQMNLPANKKRTYMSCVHVDEPGEEEGGVSCYWSPFPFELNGPALLVPSPSGDKVLVVYNEEVGSKDNPCSARLQIWGSLQLLTEIHVPSKLHGSVYTDGWFEGVAWSADETCIAYVAEEAAPSRPVFGRDSQSSKADGEVGTWKGQGDWMDDWGECYTGKRRPTIFVADINSGTVQAVGGIPNDLSAGQVVWAPPPPHGQGVQLLVFVGWTSFSETFKTPRKLGMKYCYNRPCALYSVEADSDGNPKAPLKITSGITSAFSPRFSPDGKSLVFLSAKAAVDSGAHSATNSLHFIQWPASDTEEIKDIVPVVMQPDEKGFPGLYCLNLLPEPWLRDSKTILLTSAWQSVQVIVSVNMESGEILRITPEDSIDSWNLLSVRKGFLVAVTSNPGSPPALRAAHYSSGKTLKWLDVSPPVKQTDKVQAALSKVTSKLLKIPVPHADQNEHLAAGAKLPFEALLVSPPKTEDEPAPLVLVLHGGPHSVSTTGFSRTAAFLVALGFSLLHVNYRGSIGFGDEALQSLLGKIGQQDVNDVLAALDFVIDEGFARADKVAVIGGSHGGFLTSHLIGQAPDRFVTGVLRNPVCNISSMVGITDIPDWCFVETYGSSGMGMYSDSPTPAHLSALYKASPIVHLDKVKVPTLFLLGAHDRRVPVSNGLQYAQALRARGIETKIIMFPDDIHAIDKPQSDFESFINIGVWLKRFL